MISQILVIKNKNWKKKKKNEVKLSKKKCHLLCLKEDVVTEPWIYHDGTHQTCNRKIHFTIYPEIRKVFKVGKGDLVCTLRNSNMDYVQIICLRKYCERKNFTVSF